MSYYSIEPSCQSLLHVIEIIIAIIYEGSLLSDERFFSQQAKRFQYLLKIMIHDLQTTTVFSINRHRVR